MKKANSKYISRIVKNPDASPESPNYFGDITQCETVRCGKTGTSVFYTIKFRDYTVYWSKSLVRANLLD